MTKYVMTSRKASQSRLARHSPVIGPDSATSSVKVRLIRQKTGHNDSWSQPAARPRSVPDLLLH